MVNRYETPTSNSQELSRGSSLINNLITQAEEKASRTYLGNTPYYCLPYALFARASYRQAQNEGKSISEISYKNLREQVNKLLDSILEVL